MIYIKFTYHGNQLFHRVELVFTSYLNKQKNSYRTHDYPVIIHHVNELKCGY